jgi:hypothetical protein
MKLSCRKICIQDALIKLIFKKPTSNYTSKCKQTLRLQKNMEELHPGITEGIQPGARGAYPRRAPTQDVTWHHGIDQVKCSLYQKVITLHRVLFKKLCILMVLEA